MKLSFRLKIVPLTFSKRKEGKEGEKEGRREESSEEGRKRRE